MSEPSLDELLHHKGSRDPSVSAIFVTRFLLNFRAMKQHRTSIPVISTRISFGIVFPESNADDPWAGRTPAVVPSANCCDALGDDCRHDTLTIRLSSVWNIEPFEVDEEAVEMSEVGQTTKSTIGASR